MMRIGTTNNNDERCVREKPLVSGVEKRLEDCGTVTYTNSFRRTKLMESNIIVHRGLIQQLAQHAKDIIPAHCHQSNNYLVTDSIIDPIYGEKVLKGLQAAGLKVKKFVIAADAMDEAGEPSAERSKTLANFSWLADQVLDNGIDKRSAIISLGGGVINNICGFLASSLYRGITLVHFTTSMMGQVDAAIDFKQAVNHARGKNLLGAYYPATTIVIDPEVLSTLSERHLRNGLSEAVKHAITQSEEMLDYIIKGSKDVSNIDFLEEVVKQTIAHKVPTLSGDTQDDYNEMCPQYGHAVGHAIEFLSFKTARPLLHGEAIAIGMCVTAEVAHILEICDKETVEKHYAVFKAMDLPVYIPTGMTIKDIEQKLTYDKHFLQTRPTMGLATKIGDMYRGEDGKVGRMIDPEVLRLALTRNASRGSQDDGSLSE